MTIAMLNSNELVVLALFAAILGLVPTLCFWQIFTKIGFPPPASLIAIIPGAAFVLLVVVAFAPWPSRSTDVP